MHTVPATARTMLFSFAKYEIHAVTPKSIVVAPVSMLTTVIDLSGQASSTIPITNHAIIVIIERFLIFTKISFIITPSYFFMYLMSLPSKVKSEYSPVIREVMRWS